MAELEDFIAAMEAKIVKAGFSKSGEKELEYGRQLTLTDGTGKITVNVYSGKKGISVVLGGAAGSPLRQAVQVAIDGEGFSASAAVASTVPPGFEGIEGFDNCWIGTDESGKGDFFGPLVVAAVRVDGSTAARLETAGVRDSKALSDNKAKTVARQIREICADQFAELEIMPARYNTLYSQFRSERKNLNHLLAWAHARVLEDLLQKAPCRFALADKFADEKFIQSRLMDKGRQVLLVQTPKAERNVAVAAASVLARDKFLSRMEGLSAKFGLTFPKGASAQVIEAAKFYVAEHGKAALAEVAKTHFKTSEQV